MLKRKRVLAAKIESTSGTAESLTASDALFNIYDAMMQPNIEMIQRPSQGAFSQNPAVPGAYLATCTFRTDYTGNGAAASAAWADTFFPACGFTETTDTFAPVSEPPGSNVKTLTIGLYTDGVFKSMRGCSGNFRIAYITGQPIFVEFTFQGVWVDPSDVALISPSYPTIKPIRAANATFTVGGSAYPCIESMVVESGNTLFPRECATQSDGSGLHSVIITDRLPIITMTPESDLVANEDEYGDWLDMTEAALVYSVTDGTDTVLTSAPKMQRTNVQESDRNGQQTDEVTWQCNKSAAGGDDELTIDFS